MYRFFLLKCKIKRLSNVIFKILIIVLNYVIYKHKILKKIESNFFIKIRTCFFFKYGRSFNTANDTSASIMSKYIYLRYMFTSIAILCCLVLPWTVIWIPNTSQSSYHQVNAVLKVTTSRHPIHNSPIRNFASTKANADFQIYYGDSYFTKRKKNRTHEKVYPKLLSNSKYLASYGEASSKLFDSIMTKRAVATNKSDLMFTHRTTPSLSNYYFELHILLFHIAILSCASFIQLYFYFKLTMMFIAILIYIIGLNYQRIYEGLAEPVVINLSFFKAELVLQMFFYVIFLHLIDRRVSTFIF